MDAEQAVLKQLSAQELSELKQVHEELKLPEITKEDEKESALYIRRRIVHHLVTDVVGGEDDGLATFLHLQTFIQEITKDQKSEGEPEIGKTEVTELNEVKV